MSAVNNSSNDIRDVKDGAELERVHTQATGRGEGYGHARDQIKPNAIVMGLLCRGSLTACRIGKGQFRQPG